MTLLAAAIRCYGIGHQGLWYDEAFTAMLVKLPFGRMLSTIPRTESTPPLYYCVVWVWSRIFGTGAVGLRTLSALAGTATVPVVYATARRLIESERAALIAAALTACNPLLIWYSQEARAYEPMVLLAAASLLAFSYARADPTPRHLAIWAVICALALLTHYFAALVVIPEAVWLASVHPRNRSLWAAVGLIVVVGCALLPLLIHQDTYDHNSWIGAIPLGHRLGQLLPMALLGTGTPARTPLKFAGFALLLVAVALLAMRASSDERRRAGKLALLTLSGLLTALAVTVLFTQTLLGRNLLGLLPLAILVLAAALAPRRALVPGAAVTVALCATGLTAALGVSADAALQRPGWPRVASSLGRWPAGAGGQRLVVIIDNPGVLNLTPLMEYMPGTHYVAHPSHVRVRVTEVDVISVRRLNGQGPPGGAATLACWWGAACNLSSGQIPSGATLPGFHLFSRRTVNQFTILRLRAPRAQTITARQLGGAFRTILKHDALVLQG